jgi:hypothetical protein
VERFQSLLEVDEEVPRVSPPEVLTTSAPGMRTKTDPKEGLVERSEAIIDE